MELLGSPYASHEPSKEVITSTEEEDDLWIEEDDQIDEPDVLQYAVILGNDVGEINGAYGANVTKTLLPKLVYCVEQLELMVAKRRENKKLIDSLIAEREDLHKERRQRESGRRGSERDLDELEDINQHSERYLKTQLNVLMKGNELFKEQLKRTNKKIEEQKTKMKINKNLFTGCFIPSEFQTTDMAKFHDLIDVQGKEISRLTKEIHLQKREKDQKKKTKLEPVFPNTNVQTEIVALEEKLSTVRIRRIDSQQTLEEENTKRTTWYFKTTTC